MQNNLYPKGPANVPVNFTKPRKNYRKHILIASLALVLFMVLYLGLTGWFFYKSFHLFANTFTGQRDTVQSFFSGLLLCFLGVFMIKALFFITKRNKTDDIEITQAEEPLLFEFIYKVADEAKAPRPHKVFLSNAVNASVFYHVSILNLFFPTRKNMVIGLGVVNALNLGEFKAVLAHEFGHFTQKSMIIGRWVYIVYQIARQIVSKRDALDQFLAGLSRIDIRVAWIGWILSIIVWSIRAISETFFKLVLITERALSREMEFHADLVAVSLTGSDAIVNGLYKLGMADEAYDAAIEFVNKQLKNNRAVSDVYAIQANYIKHMAVVLNSGEYGSSPKQAGNGGPNFKVFKEQIAQAPKMWSTHPSNTDREKNAKAVYIQSETDDRSPWVLFHDPDSTKNKLTLCLYKNVKTGTSPLSKQESLELHDREFSRRFLLPRYRGVFLNRHTLIDFKNIDAVYDMNIRPDEVAALLPSLYPESLQDQLAYLRDLNEEIVMLEGLNKKELDPNAGKINYRGKEISRKELPEAITDAKKEAKSISDVICKHDKLCRNVYYTIAKSAGKGWDNYLRSVTNLVHYCEHVEKNIEVQSRYFYETLAVASQIRNISNSEMYPLLTAANDLHETLSGLFGTAPTMELSASLIQKIGGKPYKELFESFRLEEANSVNINSWIKVIPSWINVASNALKALKEAAIDEMLQTEDYVQSVFNTEKAEPAPAPINVVSYPKYDPEVKREVRLKPDWFSRFYNADGIYTTIGRLAAASCIIFLAVFFSVSLGQSSVFIYNGLPVEVHVQVENKTVDISPERYAEITIDKSGAITVKTTTSTGEPIETFKTELSDNSRTYIYNVASAAVLFKSFITYGTGSFVPSSDPNYKVLGAKRWLEESADYYFMEPPNSISLPRGQSTVTRSLVTAVGKNPEEQLSYIENEEEKNNLVTAHALWENASSPNIVIWLSVAAQQKNFSEILAKRLKANPLEIISLRMQQEYYTGDERTKINEQHKNLYLAHPDNPDLYYLYVRSWGDGPKQDSAFIAGFEKWPDNYWLAYASAYLYNEHENWEKTLECYSLVNNRSSELRASIYEEMKRVCHLLNRDELMQQTNPDGVQYVKYVNAIESSQPSGTDSRSNGHDQLAAFYSFKLLNQGKLQDALDNALNDSNVYQTILMMEAVSDGVSDEVIAQATAFLSPGQMNNETMIPTLVLSIRNNLPAEKLREDIKKLCNVSPDSVLRFIKLVQTNNLAAADKVLDCMGAEMKGRMGLLGILLAGKDVPPKWNLFASALLFINEKPYRKDELKDWQIPALK